MTQRSSPAASWHQNRLSGLKTCPKTRALASMVIRPPSSVIPWVARNALDVAAQRAVRVAQVVRHAEAGQRPAASAGSLGRRSTSTYQL